MKITIEHDGARMVIDDLDPGDVLFKTVVDRDGVWKVVLDAELKDQPLWEVP